MESRDIYEKSYNYLDDIKKSLSVGSVTIDLSKLDTKSKGEVIDLLNRYCIKRRGEIWNNILSGPNSF